MKRTQKLAAAAVVALVAVVSFNAGAAGEWLRESNVWLRGIVYAGTSKLALTDSTGNISFTATTGNNKIKLTDNLASALVFTEGSNAYMTYKTTDSAESVTANKAFSAASTLSVTGAATLANASLSLTSVGTIAATGTSQGTATAIAALVNGVTATTGVAGVVLPAAATGLVTIVGSVGATGFKLYPNTSDAINATAADSSITVASGKAYVCVATDATTWVCAGN